MHGYLSIRSLRTTSALALIALLAPSTVGAQDPSTDPAAGSNAAPAPSESAAPPANTGFQAALRTGFMVPFGSVDASSSMSDAFSGQVPLLLDIGYKPIPSLFVGGYLGLGFGGSSGRLGNLCSSYNLTCVTATIRFGIEALYYFAPDAAISPWIGYGIGLESTGFGASDGNNQVDFAAAGWEFGHFMAGLDFRLSKRIGIGPLVDFSLAQYARESLGENGNTISSGSVSQTALHEWLLIGGRVVFFP